MGKDIQQAPHSRSEDKNHENEVEQSQFASKAARGALYRCEHGLVLLGGALDGQRRDRVIVLGNAVPGRRVDVRQTHWDRLRDSSAERKARK